MFAPSFSDQLTADRSGTAAGAAEPRGLGESSSVHVWGAFQQAGAVFEQRVMSQKSLVGRAGVAVGLGVATAVCTLIGSALALLAVAVQALALPIFVTRGPTILVALQKNLVAMAQESLALGVAVSTSCLFPLRPKLCHDDSSPLIVMIHGYGHSGAAWSYCQGELQKRGLQALALDWGLPLKSLEDASKVIEEQLEALRLPQGRPILAVGHSTGGVIAQRLLAAGKVQAVVSAGAPHAGTPLAVLAPGRCMRQMSPGSADLAQINNHVVVKEAPRALVCATMDLLVPTESALLESEEAPASEARTTRLHGASGGHLSLLYSPRVVEIIEQMAAQLIAPSP